MNEQVVAEFNHIKSIAEEMFDINLRALTLKTDLRCRKMGTAKMSFTNGPLLEINLNINAINGTQIQLDHIISDVIPHEMAHIVGYLKPKIGVKHHNKIWKRVCMMLGGSGDARYCGKTIGNPSQYKKKKTFEYIVDGESVQMGTVRHNRLQRGTTSYNTRVGHSVVQIKSDMWAGY